MEALIVALVGAAVAGIAFVAYNHHELFGRVWMRVVGWLWLTAGAVFCWNLSGWLAAKSIKPYVAAAKWREASSAAAGFLFHDLVVVGLTGFAFYVWAAFMVSRVVHKDADKPKQDAT